FAAPKSNAREILIPPRNLHTCGQNLAIMEPSPSGRVLNNLMLYREHNSILCYLSIVANLASPCSLGVVGQQQLSEIGSGKYGNAALRASGNGGHLRKRNQKRTDGRWSGTALSLPNPTSESEAWRR